jgi:hypothetical protein
LFVFVFKNKKEKTCTLIDVAIPADRKVVLKEAEKKLKYKSLCLEIKKMWNLKCTIIPVTIGATGIVTRILRKNLEAVPGKHSIDSLQKTAVLGTSHIIRKVLHYYFCTPRPMKYYLQSSYSNQKILYAFLILSPPATLLAHVIDLVGTTAKTKYRPGWYHC